MKPFPTLLFWFLFSFGLVFGGWVQANHHNDYIPFWSDDEEGGIGGTGVIASADEGGIGGTGIVGEITGFGSIIVNNVHIDYSPDMSVASEVGNESARNLQIGQIVVVEAEQQGDRYNAQNIRLRYSLAGPINAVDGENRRIEVMQQSVVLTDSIDISAFKQGDSVLVSGFWHQSVLQATRIDHYQYSQNFIAGPLSQRDGHSYIGQIRLQQPIESTTAQRVTARGSYAQDSGFTDTSVQTEFSPFSNKVRSAIIETYSDDSRAREYMDIQNIENQPTENGARQILKGKLKSHPTEHAEKSTHDNYNRDGPDQELSNRRSFDLSPAGSGRGVQSDRDSHSGSGNKGNSSSKGGRGQGGGGRSGGGRAGSGGHGR